MQKRSLYSASLKQFNNKKLAEAASQAGVLSENFGIFQNAGYKGLYGGLGVAEIKEKKQIDQREKLPLRQQTQAQFQCHVHAVEFIGGDTAAAAHQA
jgi:hypothetical protein